MPKRVTTADKEKALFFCAERGTLDAAKELIMNGVNVNCKNRDGDGPLHLAVFYGNVEMVKLLVAAGAHITILNNVQDTPLQVLQKTFVSTDPRKARIEKALNGGTSIRSCVQVVPMLAKPEIDIVPSAFAWVRRLGEAAQPYVLEFIAGATSTSAPSSATARPTTPTAQPAAFDLLIPHVPDDNWLAPLLRQAGMTNENIVQECCGIIVGAFEYTKAGFASLRPEEFKEKVLPMTNITVPGRLATLCRVQQHLHFQYKVVEEKHWHQRHQPNRRSLVERRAGADLSDQLSDLSIDLSPPLNTVSTEAARHSSAAAGAFLHARSAPEHHAPVHNSASVPAHLSQQRAAAVQVGSNNPPGSDFENTTNSLVAFLPPSTPAALIRTHHRPLVTTSLATCSDPEVPPVLEGNPGVVSPSPPLGNARLCDLSPQRRAWLKLRASGGQPVQEDDREILPMAMWKKRIASLSNCVPQLQQPTRDGDGEGANKRRRLETK